MRTSTIALFAASMATVFTLGCRGGDDSSDGSDADADADTDADADQPDDDADGDVSGEVTIYQVQGTEVSDGASIILDNVIVTAIDTYGARTGTFFVQDPMGGEFSGVLVFGASPADVAGLTPGDRVRIEGAKKVEFTGPMSGPFQDGYSTTEVVPESTGSMTVTVLDSGAVPAPALVDAAAIAALPDFMDRHAEWEKWEGVLIKVENVNALGLTECVGSACPDATNTTTPITGDIDIQTSLAALPSSVALGDCFASVTGVVDYFYDYHIYNTSADAVVTGGTGCELENQIVDISEVQSGAATGLVTLEEVYVTALNFSRKNFWVSSSLTAAPNEGIYVFRGGSAAALPAEIVVGSRVTIVGTATEFDGTDGGETLTQIAFPQVTFVAAPTTPTVAVTNQTAATLAVPGTGEPFESVLVTLTNVKVNALGNADNFFTATVEQNGTVFNAYGDIYRMVTEDNGKCFASITGIWTYNPFMGSNAYGLVPLATGTGTGTCN